MRKLTLLLSLLCAVGLSAQTVIRDVFKNMPDSVIPYLTENNRLDMIDFMASSMDAVVANALGGKSQMLALTDQYAFIRLSESSDLAMRLLDVTEPVDSASQVLCLVRTYGSDIRESNVAFYSLSWRQLPTNDYFSHPDETFVATLDKESPTLTLTKKFYFDELLKEEQEDIKEMSIILKWCNCFVKKD